MRELSAKPEAKDMEPALFASPVSSRKAGAFREKEERRSEGAFAAPAETEWSWLLLTPRRFFSFSERERKEWGRKSGGQSRPPLRRP